MPPVKSITERDATITRDGIAKAEPYTIRCYLDVAVTLGMRRAELSGERLLAAQALRLLIRLDAELKEARADWNQDRFRRVMQARYEAALRVFRRWSRLNPSPQYLLAVCVGDITLTWLAIYTSQNRPGLRSVSESFRSCLSRFPLGY